MGLVDDGAKTVRKLARARYQSPTPRNQPASICEASRGRAPRSHAACERKRLIDLHAAAPTVIHQRRIGGGLPGEWIVENLPTQGRRTLPEPSAPPVKPPTKTVGVVKVSCGSRRVRKGPGSGFKPTAPDTDCASRASVKRVRPLNSIPHTSHPERDCPLDHEPWDDFAFVLISGVRA